MEAATQRHKSISEIETEQKMVQLAQKDPQQFEALYNAYYDEICQFIYRRVDSKDTTFDIASQVFMKALANIASYKNQGVPFSAWLYKIAFNELANHYKKSKKNRVIDIESSHLDTISSELQEASTSELYDKIIEAIQYLTEPEVYLLELRFFENRPFKEIGDILSITENNAKVKVYRIITKLKSLLQ